MEAGSTLHIVLALGVAVAMFTGFALGRLGTEIVSLLTIAAIALLLYWSPLPGTSPYDGLTLAFSGFGHPALVAICALMVMGRGLVVTGALEPVARSLERVWRFNTHIGLLVTLLMAFGASMVVNDTPVLVLLIPIMAQLAARGAMPASKTLIPLNAAILMGGMATTIGTSTNILVVAMASDLGLKSIGIFSFTPIVLGAALICLPFIWLVMPRLLPDNSPRTGHAGRLFHADVRLREESSWAGRPIGDAERLLPQDFALLDTGSQYDPGRFSAVATADGLREGVRQLEATAIPEWLHERMADESLRLGEDLIEAELAISADSRIIGTTIPTAGIENVGILGVYRADDGGPPFSHTAPFNTLAEGDILLVLGTERNIHLFARNESLLILEGARPLPRSGKAVAALAIMVASVMAASFGLVPIAISALAGAVAMFVTGCVHFDKVGRALSAKVIVLVAASIALGRYMLDSGAAGFLGDLLAGPLGYLPFAAVIAVVMAFVTILTNFASNTTAAAVGTPIAFSIASEIGMQVEPLVLAVLFGCNLCYATPIAYQTNMLIMAEGNYQFRDYVRTGVPLVILMTVSLSALLAFEYNLL